MEAYVSLKQNAFADLHALAAMRAIPPAVLPACNGDGDGKHATPKRILQ